MNLGWFQPQYRELKNALRRSTLLPEKQKAETLERLTLNQQLDSLQFKAWPRPVLGMLVLLIVLLVVILFFVLRPQFKQVEIWFVIGLLLVSPLICYVLKTRFKDLYK